ncbi:hypothetical protein [Thiocystis violacea]|uniref:hypothetical protein n=1 Tax=Thiocystis violacea TaxID=13725 RepID=UPI0019085966|nr:hypothetical protein [Thiocystis violacea]
MLIHPAVAPPYEEVVNQLFEGLAQGTSQDIGVCALDALNARSWSRPPRQVVAVGGSAYAAAEQAFSNARVLPILVGTLPAAARDGLSRFVDPSLVLAQLRALSPNTETLYFIHLQAVPDDLVRRAQRSAETLGLRWIPIAVGSLREAALAIERVRGEASTTSDDRAPLQAAITRLGAHLMVKPVRPERLIGTIVTLIEQSEQADRGTP